MGSLDPRERTPDERLFTLKELLIRNPDYVTAYSSDYDAPVPFVRSYYSSLLRGDFPYVVVFDRQTGNVPWWVCPHDIDFLQGRITILARKHDPFRR